MTNAKHLIGVDLVDPLFYPELTHIHSAVLHNSVETHEILRAMARDLQILGEVVPEEFLEKAPREEQYIGGTLSTAKCSAASDHLRRSRSDTFAH